MNRFTTEFEYEVEQLGKTFSVTAEWERGEAAVIDRGNPERAQPSGAALLLGVTAFDGETKWDGHDLSMVFVAKERKDLELRGGKPFYNDKAAEWQRSIVFPTVGYGKTYMDTSKGVLELVSLQRLIDEAAEAHLEREGEPE